MEERIKEMVYTYQVGYYSVRENKIDYDSISCQMEKGVLEFKVILSI